MTKEEQQALKVGDRVARRAVGRLGGVGEIVAANDHAVRIKIDRTDETYIISRSELRKDFDLITEVK